MKVYLVYLPEESVYSYSGYNCDVNAVFSEESKAKEYAAKLNKSIRDKQGHAYVVPVKVDEIPTP